MHNLIDDIHFADVRAKCMTPYWITWTKFAIRSAVSMEPASVAQRCTTALDGGVRPRPQDGYSPVVRDYDTGLPHKG